MPVVFIIVQRGGLSLFSRWYVLPKKMNGMLFLLTCWDTLLGEECECVPLYFVQHIDKLTFLR